MLVRWVAVAMILLVPTAPGLAATVADHLALQLRSGPTIATTDRQVESLAILEGFYAGRGMAPLWIEATGVTPRGRQVAGILAAADGDGLRPDDYAVPAVAALLAARGPDRLAELEVRLSLGLMLLIADLGQGRTTPHVADPGLFLYRDEVDRRLAMEGVGEADDLPAFVDRYRPQAPIYARLRTALADYRRLAEGGGWAAIPGGPSLKPGMTDQRVALIRRRLRLWGELAATEASGGPAGDLAGDPERYDDALVDAVKRMQARHGLDPDGIVGRKTLGALNLPVETRIGSIVLNLERLRWMPDDLGRRHVFVNLADFRLTYADDGDAAFDTRVIVGEPYHRTPVFSSAMTHVVFNPDWTVPQSIARRLLLPQIKADPGFLARNNYTLFSDWTADATVVDPAMVDWSQVSAERFSFKLRQSSGPGNALGRVKFLLPNRFDVYLHDTSARQLFGKTERSLSNGCIRIEHSERLAELILADAETWSMRRIEETIAGGRTTFVKLPESIPVHIGYLTAWVDAEGAVQFRKDIYQRDLAVADALVSRSVD
ncbi:MAG: L,D-transpeptidase family protein [Inquilinus sp.]|nr:L,D-transpeptidase family protein [Inquilinus sp.]